MRLQLFFLLDCLFLKKLHSLKHKNSVENDTGLSYGSSTVGDLVGKDTDSDGVPDWEEGLWGTDPTKKETTPGLSDSDAIVKLKAEETAGTGANTSSQDQNLTKTDQFSREFLATVSSLSENGSLDQATVDKLGSSVAEQIKNSEPKKVYTITDIKIAKTDTQQSITTYNTNLNNLYKKTSTKYSVIDVLGQFAPNDNTINASALTQLDPIIKEMNDFLQGMIKTDTPPSIVSLHLNMINSLERVVENLNDIKLTILTSSFL